MFNTQLIQQSLIFARQIRRMKLELSSEQKSYLVTFYVLNNNLKDCTSHPGGNKLTENVGL